MNKEKVTFIFGGSCYKEITIPDDGRVVKSSQYLLYDIRVSGKYCAKFYQVSQWKKLKDLNPKKGEIFSGDFTVEKNGSLVSISRPSKLKREPFIYNEENFEYIVSKYIKENKVFTKKDLNIEKIAYVRLLQFDERIDFWKFLSLPFKLNSLNFFFTPDGQEIIQENKKKFDKQDKISYDNVEEVVLGEKICSDVQFDQDNQGLMEFLK